ncbi:hypothetical protein ACJMK2_039397 [Sinanodonta woodiana]|uniref:Peptidase M12B domain-containing protein n=1 Tax=Sinanodonta woodiana TaxID=1069815 RepID=A0ABD3WF87_SINWO
MGDFFSTVTNAAHELGHNLGAFHDGEGDAKACNPDDQFIMAPDDKEFIENELYSRNPWLFSNCSIESFKKTLQNKTCVTNKGVFFNNGEWMRYVTKEPGEAYYVNEQCALINGPNSKSCGAASPKTCLFMKCTDPNTGKCMSANFRAARGTTCGMYMWCIEGMCVAKDFK